MTCDNCGSETKVLSNVRSLLLCQPCAKETRDLINVTPSTAAPVESTHHYLLTLGFLQPARLDLETSTMILQDRMENHTTQLLTILEKDPEQFALYVHLLREHTAFIERHLESKRLVEETKQILRERNIRAETEEQLRKRIEDARKPRSEKRQEANMKQIMDLLGGI